jgi:hypothetical protein
VVVDYPGNFLLSRNGGMEYPQMVSFNIQSASQKHASLNTPMAIFYINCGVRIIELGICHSGKNNIDADSLISDYIHRIQCHPTHILVLCIQKVRAWGHLLVNWSRS